MAHHRWQALLTARDFQEEYSIMASLVGPQMLTVELAYLL